jgi:hypothetical protein
VHGLHARVGCGLRSHGLDEEAPEQALPVIACAQPEMSRNVQKYSKDVYLRASEAQQCRVHSTVVLPLFTSADRKSSLGVVEVVQTQQDMSFSDIVATLAQSLEVGYNPAGPPCCACWHSGLWCSIRSTATACGMRG